MPHAQIGDIKLFYEVQGSGTPVVLIPGLGADTRLFSRLTPQIALGHQVIVLDPRGAGQSDKPRGEYTIEQMANDVAELLSTLGTGRAAVMGYSMGGKIALQLAATSPERVDRLILAATAARPPVTRRFSQRWFMMNVVSKIPKPRRVDSQPSYAFDAQRRASAAFDGRELLSQVTARTLIIRARRDRMVAATDVAELRAIPQSTLLDLPGGHLSLLMVHGTELAQAVCSFLDSPA